MKVYTLRYEEKCVGYFTVEAESYADAVNKIEEMKENGEIDSDLEVDNSVILMEVDETHDKTV